MKNQIFNYYYLDEDKIDSLFAQLDKLHIDKITRKILNTTKGKGKGKTVLGSIFGRLGLGEIDLEAELSKEKISSEEFSEHLLVEHKILGILDSLKEEKKLVLLTKDNFDTTTIQMGQFVELVAFFRTPDFQEKDISSETLMQRQRQELYFHEVSKEKRREVQNRGHMFAMENLDKPDNIFSSGFVTFKCCLGKSLIHMGTSLVKYTIGLHHLMIAWHYRKVKLNVFGQLTPIKENEFYLKPFSIRHA